LRHKRLTPLGGEKDANHADDKIFVCSNQLSSNNLTVSWRVPTIDPKELMGRKSLKGTEGDGHQFLAQII
jgi:hypothetical protein